MCQGCVANIFGSFGGMRPGPHAAPLPCDGRRRGGGRAGGLGLRCVDGRRRSHLPRRPDHPDGRRQPDRRGARGQERQDRRGRRRRRGDGPQIRVDRDRRSRRPRASAGLHRPAPAHGDRRAGQRALHRLRLHQIQDPRRALRDVPRQGGQDAGRPVAAVHQLRQSAAGRRSDDGRPRRRLEGSSDPRLLHQHAHRRGQQRRLRRREDPRRHRRSAGRRPFRPRRLGQARRHDLRGIGAEEIRRRDPEDHARSSPARRWSTGSRSTRPSATPRVHEAGVLVFGNLLEGYERVAAISPCRASISLMYEFDEGRRALQEIRPRRARDPDPEHDADDLRDEDRRRRLEPDEDRRADHSLSPRHGEGPAEFRRRAAEGDGRRRQGAGLAGVDPLQRRRDARHRARRDRGRLRRLSRRPASTGSSIARSPGPSRSSAWRGSACSRAS